MDHARVARLIAASEEFFHPLGGRLGTVYVGRRRNIEILHDGSVPEVAVASLEVTFEDAGIFGDEGFMAAYQRYRRMRSDWWRHLEGHGLGLWNADTRLIPHLHPLTDGEVRGGQPYPLQEQAPYGQHLTPHSALEGRDPYYQALFESYGVRWLLQEDNGIVIGPDAGLLFGVGAAADVRGSLSTFADVGAGTGELSAHLLRRGAVRRLLLNEVSPHLQDHLRRYVGGLAVASAADVEYHFCNALDLDLPTGVDLLSVGIYYGAQPAFFRRLGPGLGRHLAADGLVLVQSGMLEGTFNVAALTGEDPRLLAWPWYDESHSLTTWLPHVRSYFVADEVVTFAARQASTIEAVVERLRSLGKARPLEALQRFESAAGD